MKESENLGDTQEFYEKKRIFCTAGGLMDDTGTDHLRSTVP